MRSRRNANSLLLSPAGFVPFVLLTLAAFAALAQRAAPPAASPAGPATAPAATQPAAEPPPAAAGLVNERGNRIAGVQLTKADVRVVVRAPLARVTATLTFTNYSDRLVGGEMAFPLPEGATVTGYGLEVNGVMVDGVAVEKQQGRRIYDSEVHQQVDPGLVEHAGGNVFRARLYPILAKTSRAMKVQYVTELTEGAAGAGGARGIGVARLVLPMGWAKSVRCTLALDVPEAPAEPRLPSGAAELAFHPAGHGFAAAGALREAPDPLVVAIPWAARRSVIIEQQPPPTADDDAADPRAQPNCYFLLTDTPPAPPPGPAPEAAADLRAKAVRRVAILWDAGLNRAASDLSAQRKVLGSLLQAWGDAAGGGEKGEGADGGATADLVVFRDVVEPPVRFDVSRPRERARLLDQLAGLAYDGASDLARVPLPKDVTGFPAGASPAASPAASRSGGGYDCLLLFSNGLASAPAAGLPKAGAPVYAFSDAPWANLPLLKAVCRDSGGRYVELSQSGPGGLRREPWSLVSVDCKPTEVADLSPAAPFLLGASRRLVLTGRLTARRATLTLNYGYGSQVLSRQRFTLQVGGAVHGDLVSRYWAQRRVADLSRQPDVNDTELSTIGKRFNMVTPNTSLLVLETAEQYARYQVAPPRNQPRLYQAYLAKTPSYRSEPWPKEAPWEAEQRLESAVRDWARRVQWWENPAGNLPPPEGSSQPSFTRAEGQDSTNSRAAELRQRAERAADARRSRELAREAGWARKSGDLTGARDLYAQAVVLDRDNAVADQALQTLAEALATDTAAAPARVRLEEQAARRAARAAATCGEALSRVDSDVQKHDLAQAESDLDRAREALGSDVTAWDRSERSTLADQLAAAQRRLDAARLAAARNARHEREVARAQRPQYEPREPHGPDPWRQGVNPGAGDPSFFDRMGRSGFGAGGASRSLFGGAGGTAGGGAGGAPVPPQPPPPVGSTAITSVTAAAPLPDIPPGAWNPAAPYVAAMRAAPAEKAYGVYLSQRPTYGITAAFYLDWADSLQQAGLHAPAVRVLSDVMAYRLNDPDLLRVVARRLQVWGEWTRAVELFERVRKLRPGETQDDRDLALALSDRGDARAVRAARAAGAAGSARLPGDAQETAADYGRCLELLSNLISGPRTWLSDDAKAVYLMEANRIVAKVGRLQAAGRIPLVPLPLGPRLVRDLDCDLRVVLSWDSARTRARLVVTEPDGHEASYSQYSTPIGGLLNGATTNGGPGEYCLRRLVPGRYRLRCRAWVGDSEQPPTDLDTLRLTVFTHFGRADEAKQVVTFHLPAGVKQSDLGELTSDGNSVLFRKDADSGPKVVPRSGSLP